ncbi:MAG: hypothetical protein H6836_07215 [Planctomycetes bacterium]|nr:hypothetical protein [Planctomycetota bacterium]MCB9889352.1 hypothetical protein [Planctomycetota bacterium]
MRLQSDLSVAVLGFVALNVGLAFAAIGLFLRMGPAAERILLRNDATIFAAEDILTVLAGRPGAIDDPDDRTRVAAAIERIASNITEDREPAVIEAIRQLVPAAVAGDATARNTLIVDLRRLIAINRDAMQRADREAQRLGRAGAWAAALVAIASLGLSLFLGRRLGSHVVRPVLELGRVLRAAQSGDRFRRCNLHPAPRELRDALVDLNRLLDSRDQAEGIEQPEPAER